MTDPTPLDKAEAAAREAASNTDIVRIVATVLAAQQAMSQQQPAPPQCHHDHGRPRGRSASEWLALSCAVCIGGFGIAFASIALAIGGISAAILALVLRSMWRDTFQKGR
ncbi:hypothetical protein ACIGMX_16240 [Streptomyces aquilus]|uniref:hypothetical protein n=1 Tax=Streptomyces aquilus TaxID=2548456 RepID=UPI0037D6E07A